MSTTTMTETGEASAVLTVPGVEGLEISVFGTEKIRQGFDETCLRQAVNTMQSPGVAKVVLNPDAHAGYGAPIGCVLASPSHVYPGPVGVDIKCSMSLLQTDLPAEEIMDRRVRRHIINSVLERIPTGPGRGVRHCKKSRTVLPSTGRKLAIEGASDAVLLELGIPTDWSHRCEDAFHLGHNQTRDALALRLEQLEQMPGGEKLADKYSQLGSYGGGNHFGECEVVKIERNDEARLTAEAFGLLNGRVAFLSHCGSRGFGFMLAQQQFKAMQNDFLAKGIAYPAGDRELVHAELGSPLGNDYLDDMAMGANFATVNHLLINALVLEAFQEVFPGVKGELVYFISHNIARPEMVDGKMMWVHRKGATRAFPAGHPGLVGTRYEQIGHPILLPGNPREGSVVMVATPEAHKSCFSVNHGAGRRMGRKAAIKALDQERVDRELDKHDILTNCRRYPKDEAPDAYKDFDEVVRSVELAGLAKTVARLTARFVIKDGDTANGGLA